MCLDMFKRSVVKISIEVDNTNSQVFTLDLSTTVSEAIFVIGGYWTGYGLSDKKLSFLRRKHDIRKKCNFYPAGGTLVIFTGASLISTFEFIYWLCRVRKLTDT